MLVLSADRNFVFVRRDRRLLANATVGQVFAGSLTLARRFIHVAGNSICRRDLRARCAVRLSTHAVCQFSAHPT